MYSEERMLVWRFIFFCNERKLFAERPLMLDTAFQLINDFDEAEHARLRPKPTAPPEADSSARSRQARIIELDAVIRPPSPEFTALTAGGNLSDT